MCVCLCVTIKIYENIYNPYKWIERKLYMYIDSYEMNILHWKNNNN